MNISQLVALALSFILALAASWALLTPFFSRREALVEGGDEDIRLIDLGLRKDMVLQSLEDLELERRSGKVSAEQYATTKAELSREAAGYLQQIDRLQAEAGTEEEEAAVEEERDLSGRE